MASSFSRQMIVLEPVQSMFRSYGINTSVLLVTLVSKIFRSLLKLLCISILKVQTDISQLHSF